MTTEEKVTRYHDSGYNCCQSVLCALGEYTGLPEAVAARLASGFGGGMRCGSVCGTVTGSLMAVGCACIAGACTEEEKEYSTALTEELEEIFSAKMGTLMCDDILRDHERTLCPDCMIMMAHEAEKIIRREKKLDS